MKRKIFFTGILFIILWPSAAVATKIALQAAQPFVIAVTRFFIAGFLMLIIAHGIMGKRLPAKKQFGPIMFYGLLNVSIYLGLYIIAMQRLSAGLGTLAIGINPVLISFMAAIFFRERITATGFLSLALCLAGIIIAAFPLLRTSSASISGLIIIMVSMLAYSSGAIYYARRNWEGLDIITINGWQTIFGGIFLLPFLFFTYDKSKNVFDAHFWSGVLWMAVPVSIAAVQCWMILLKNNAAKAAFWLFLCPVVGFLLARVFLKEALGWHTALGVLFVLAGLYLSQRYKVTVPGKKALQT